MNTIGCEAMIMGGCNCRDCAAWTGYGVTKIGERISHPFARTKDGRRRKYCQEVGASTVKNFGCESYTPIEMKIIQPLSAFAKLLGVELNRYDLDGNLVNSVECTEDNLINLFNSQFEQKTKYGTEYRYVINNQN